MPLAPTPFKYFCLGCHKAVAKWILSGATDGGEIACAKHQKELEEAYKSIARQKKLERILGE